ncbi:COG3011 Predicted thiol-disulfide oxidoreductase [Candidatus Nanopelagicaceae bacterium]
MPDKKATVIFDGECRFCLASLNWLRSNLDIDAHPFQSADLAHFHLTRAQCEKEVIALIDGTVYGGAQAVAQLLALRGNRNLSRYVKASGKLGDLGYRWVATHRNSLPVKVLTVVLERAAR